jgi:hypothetical protein
LSPDGGAHKVVTNDGKRESHIILYHDQSANVPINAGPTGMAFMGDGSRLLKLPNLSTDWVERRQGDRRFVLYRRASNLLLVTDPKTGEILRKITLVKPTN